LLLLDEDLIACASCGALMEVLTFDPPTLASDSSALQLIPEAPPDGDHLGFEIRYIFNGGEHKYRPDFLVKLSSDEMLVIEIKGEEDQKDKVKREAMREWVRAVNQHGGFGRWYSEPAISKRPDDIPQILERAMKAK
jgi:hypothetical protein